MQMWNWNLLKIGSFGTIVTQALVKISADAPVNFCVEFRLVCGGVLHRKSKVDRVHVSTE